MEDTAKVGAEPAWKVLLRPLMNERGELGDKSDPPPDKGDDKSDPPPDKGDKKSDPPADDKVPWDEDPRWKEWRGAEKKVQSLLKANKVESVEELEGLLEEGTTLKGRVKDIQNIDELMEKATTFDQYQEYWGYQDELKKREDEEPDETIKRLEGKIMEGKRVQEDEKKSKAEAAEAEKAIKTYEREVKSLVREAVGKEESGFINEFFGVDNPFNEIDITDTKAIEKMVKEGVKKKETYDQMVIKKYLAGKTEVPDIPSGDTTVPDVPKIKNLKEARKIFAERVGRVFGDK